jgi:hypothetical protein
VQDIVIPYGMENKLFYFIYFKKANNYYIEKERLRESYGGGEYTVVAWGGEGMGLEPIKTIATHRGHLLILYLYGWTISKSAGEME